MNLKAGLTRVVLFVLEMSCINLEYRRTWKIDRMRWISTRNKYGEVSDVRCHVGFNSDFEFGSHHLAQFYPQSNVKNYTLKLK